MKKTTTKPKKERPPQLRVYGPFMGMLRPGEEATIALPEGVDPNFHEVVIGSIRGAPVETVSLLPEAATVKNASTEPSMYALMVIPRWGIRAATLPWKDIVAKLTAYVNTRKKLR